MLTSLRDWTTTRLLARIGFASESEKVEVSVAIAVAGALGRIRRYFIIIDRSDRSRGLVHR